jgi:hypothetical protein
MSDQSHSATVLYPGGLLTFRELRGGYRPRLPPDQKRKSVVIGIGLPEKIATRIREEGAKRGIAAASMLQPLVPILIDALDREAAALDREAAARDASVSGPSEDIPRAVAVHRILLV